MANFKLCVLFATAFYTEMSPWRCLNIEAKDSRYSLDFRHVSISSKSEHQIIFPN